MFFNGCLFFLYVCIHYGSFDRIRNMVRVFGLKWMKKKNGRNRGKEEKTEYHLHWRGNWWKLVNNPLHIPYTHTHSSLNANGWMGVWIYYYSSSSFFLSFVLRQWEANEIFMFAISRSNQIEFIFYFISHSILRAVLFHCFSFVVVVVVCFQFYNPILFFLDLFIFFISLL